MELWQSILLAFGGNAALLLVLGFLGRSLLVNLMTRDAARFQIELKARTDSEIERLKSELKARADSEIERLKSELQIRALEHGVKFSKLHDRRAKVIADVYEKLVSVLQSSERFLNPGRWRSEARIPSSVDFSTATREILDSLGFLNRHRLYLPEAVAEQVGRLLREIREQLSTSGQWTKLQIPEELLTQEDRAMRAEDAQQAYDAIQKQIKPAKLALEEAFRGLLGESVEQIGVRSLPAL